MNLKVESVTKFHTPAILRHSKLIAERRGLRDAF